MLKCHRTAFWLALLSATAVDRASPVVTAEDAMISNVLASYSLPELEALGRAVIHQPPPLDEDSSASNNLPYMAQPFFMTVGVKLQAGYDYAGWRLCQRVIHEDASSLRQPFGEHCSLMWVENSAVNFSPVLGLSPPEYDFLKPGVHEAEAWFETGDISRNSSDNLSGNSSSSGPYRAWGRVTRLFEAGPPPLRDMHGAVIYLDDSTDTVDNSITSNIAHPDAIETQPSLGSPSVVGVIIEPRNHHPNLAYVIHNVATQLPAVRPMYVFHGPNFDPCRAAVESHGKVGSEAKASAALLCELVRTEQVLLHKLRVDNFTFRDYNRFVTSKAFWNRIGGDKALFFQTDTVVCSGRAFAGIGSFAKRLDYVGGRQRLKYFLGDPPELVEEELFGGNGGFSLRDVALSRACAVEGTNLPSSGYEQEDVHFPHCIAARGGRVATPADQDAFAAYTFPVAGALGAHKLDLRTTGAQTFVQEACLEYQGLVGV